MVKRTTAISLKTEVIKIVSVMTSQLRRGAEVTPKTRRITQAIEKPNNNWCVIDWKLPQMSNKISARITKTNYLNRAVGSAFETLCMTVTKRSSVKKCASVWKGKTVINCLHNERNIGGFLSHTDFSKKVKNWHPYTNWLYRQQLEKFCSLRPIHKAISEFNT